MENEERMRICTVLERWMAGTGDLRQHCDRCLDTRRWGGSVVLMVLDAAFTSIGLNYFTLVVPAVRRFEHDFVDTAMVTDLRHLAAIDVNSALWVWRNRRSWEVARGVAAYVAGLAHAGGLEDRKALRQWAVDASMERWKDDPVGRVRGVGLTTFQYLRMMGGVDTVMPDTIVRRVIRQVVREAGIDLSVEGDLDLVDTVGLLARSCGYRVVELCWMTWMVQREGAMVRMDKYRDILGKI